MNRIGPLTLMAVGTAMVIVGLATDEAPEQTVKLVTIEEQPEQLLEVTIPPVRVSTPAPALVVEPTTPVPAVEVTPAATASSPSVSVTAPEVVAAPAAAPEAPEAPVEPSVLIDDEPVTDTVNYDPSVTWTDVDGTTYIADIGMLLPEE